MLLSELYHNSVTFRWTATGTGMITIFSRVKVNLVRLEMPRSWTVGHFFLPLSHPYHGISQSISSSSAEDSFSGLLPEVAPFYCTVSVNGVRWSCACGDLHPDPVARNLSINQDQASMGLGDIV